MVKSTFAASYSKRRNTFSTQKKKIDMKDLITAEALNLPEVINLAVCWKAYHLEEGPCELHVPPNPKVKNCRQNPYCISRLGLEKIEKLKNQQQESTCSNLERRDLEKQPCGLANNGNWCYVNSFLQIWYNDLVFRQCIYDWRSCPEFIKPDATKMDVQAVMDTLQRLFVSMQFTPFECDDAVELIKLLKLDNEQHDVQEFNTLFFDALDRNLIGHPTGEAVRKLIRSRFESKIKQTIYCDFCGVNSESEGEYRSLQISIENFKTLTSAITGFFELEILSDYTCDGCKKKGTATRSSHFSQLPKVLVIQLNRYVFDSSGRHKKLRTPIQYPRTLPEAVLQPDSSFDRNYDLCAVMIHEGPNTHCGHYYDLIRDPVSGQWYTYNDRTVVQTKAPGVSVEKENDKLRATNDMKGCYALIYQLSDSAEGISSDSLRLPPQYVVNSIQKKLNADFLVETKEGNRSLNFWNKEVGRRHDFLDKMWNKLEITNGKEMRKRQSELVFLPTSLLSDILIKEFKAIEEMKNLDHYETKNGHDKDVVATNNQNGDDHFSTKMSNGVSYITSTQIEVDEAFEETPFLSEDEAQIYAREPLEDCRMYLCPHDRVSLISVFKAEVKAVNRSAAEELLNHYGIGIAMVPADTNLHEEPSFNDSHSRRLKTGLDICIDCVRAMKREATFKSDLGNCVGLTKTLKQRTLDPNRDHPMSTEQPTPDAVWVSEKHLRSFKKLAVDQMEYQKKMSSKALKDLVFSISLDGFHKTVRQSARNNNTILPTTSRTLSPRPGTSSSMDLDNYDCSPSTSSRFSNNNPANRKRKHELSQEPTENTTNNYVSGTPNSSSRPNSSASGEVEANSDTRSDLNGGDECVIVNEVNGKPSKFNDDLLCKHGNLTFAVKRVWLNKWEWDLLKSNYTDYVEAIPCSTAECSQCVENFYEERTEQATNLSLLDAIQNEILKTMRSIERRRNWQSTELGLVYTRVLCPKFVHKICKPSRTKNNVEIPRICQDCLLCQHHSLPYKVLDEQENDKCPAGFPITYQEWNDLLRVYAKHLPSYPCPTEIKLSPNGAYDSFCATCNLQHMEEEDNKRFSYPEGGDIYIKLQGDGGEEQEVKTSLASVTTRRLAAKNLWKFKMTSYDKVIDLKLKVYEQIKQSPADQLIYLSDIALDDGQTLESARVEANNVDNPLVLIVQQRMEVSSSASGEPRQLEKGFRDTALSI